MQASPARRQPPDVSGGEPLLRKSTAKAIVERSGVMKKARLVASTCPWSGTR